MISTLIKLITKKQIVLFDKHRHTMPIAKNLVNRKVFYFIDIPRMIADVTIVATIRRINVAQMRDKTITSRQISRPADPI